MSEYFLILAGVILALVGLGFILSAIISNQRTKTAESWPTIPGTVLHSEVMVHVTRNKGVTTRTYEPIVHYQYNLMGKPYESKKVSFGSLHMKDDQAEEIVSRYPAGSSVTVHYDPNKPEKSVLEVTARGGKTLMVSGGIFIVMGIVLFILQLV
jgi:hypothetical protein